MFRSYPPLHCAGQGFHYQLGAGTVRDFPTSQAVVPLPFTMLGESLVRHIARRSSHLCLYVPFDLLSNDRASICRDIETTCGRAYVYIVIHTITFEIHLIIRTQYACIIQLPTT